MDEKKTTMEKPQYFDREKMTPRTRCTRHDARPPQEEIGGGT